MAPTNRTVAAGFAIVAAVVVCVVLARGCGATTAPDAAPDALAPSRPVAAPAPASRRAETPQPQEEAASQGETPAPPTPEFETVKFRIAVTHADGTPAAGATVAVVNPGGATHSEVEVRGRTADDGAATVELPHGIYRVVAWCGDEAAVLDAVAAPPDAAVRLEPAVRVRGRVTQRDGSPVPGASVRYVAWNWKVRGVGVSFAGEIAANGSFVLTLPRSALDGQTDGWADAKAPSFIPSKTQLTADSASTETVLVLERGVLVRGRLVFGDDAPVAGAVVETSNATTIRTRTAADGSFALTLPCDGGRLVALREWRVEVKPDLPAGGRRSVEHGTGLVLGDFTADADLGLVRFPAGRPVAGIVVDAAGTPLSHMYVGVQLGDSTVEETQTDEEGRFVVPYVGPDAHEVVVVENASQSGQWKRVEGVRGGDAELRVVLSGERSVVLRLLPGPGPNRHVPRFQVTWTGDAGSGEQTFRPQNLPGEIRVWFDRAGTCSLAVKAKGFEPATASGVAVFADRESSAEVTLRAIPDFPSDAGTAVLILVDADTKSLVSTGHVDLRWRPSGSADPATSSTWSGGPFQSVQFSPPAAGRFEVTLRTAGYETATVVVDVAEDKGSAVEVPLRKRKPD